MIVASFPVHEAVHIWQAHRRGYEWWVDVGLDHGFPTIGIYVAYPDSIGWERDLIERGELVAILVSFSFAVPLIVALAVLT